ncbi:MAG: T9SS type A sorting domain-containing protein [Candidatus Kapabacteria bacterium]|nr:T9SS type A sorting domain-containing protein [Candidatus Kapabacteria bacterium]
MQIINFRLAFLQLTVLLGVAMCAVAPIRAADEAFVPVVTTLQVGQRVRVAVIGTLEQGGDIKITFRYNPTVMRIVGSQGSTTNAFRCSQLTVVEDRVESATSAIYTVGCPFSVSIANDTLLTLDLEGIGGSDTVGFLQAEKIEANGVEVVGAMFNSGEVVRTGGITARQKVTMGITGNYPNPFSTHTRFVYTLDAPDVVTLFIRNAQGRLVKEIGPLNATAGENYYDYQPDLSQVANGAYLLQLTTTGGSYYHPMTVMK